MLRGFYFSVVLHCIACGTLELTLINNTKPRSLLWGFCFIQIASLVAVRASGSVRQSESAAYYGIGEPVPESSVRICVICGQESRH